MRRRPVVSAFVSAPIDTPPALGSLCGNQLCGVNWEGEGTYTADGITKLCEALKGSAVTTLECAPALRVFAFLSMPIDTPSHRCFPFCPSLAVSVTTSLETGAPPQSLPSSRRRRSLT